ncbi:hypothetical protein [Catellatospora chokoriensis]|uniref:Uncharacterized protein n=1 Tax=Catellatospora chokoriensis TaxID=310353 RepID=A0A8J3NQH8_9ACTN|nr:hypothetical protein [Catellatospora chokoriensis]GIF88915.1 hypothetical protein Cch02nite_23590 [Catellatospora chokoriensis]
MTTVYDTGMSSVDEVPLRTWLVAVVTFPALPLVLLLERGEFAAAFGRTVRTVRTLRLQSSEVIVI